MNSTLIRTDTVHQFNVALTPQEVEQMNRAADLLRTISHGTRTDDTGVARAIALLKSFKDQV